MSSRVTIAGLRPGIDAAVLRDRFHDFGEIDYVKESESGEYVVAYADDDSAVDAAVALDQTTVCGAKMQLTPYVGDRYANKTVQDRMRLVAGCNDDRARPQRRQNDWSRRNGRHGRNSRTQRGENSGQWRPRP